MIKNFHDYYFGLSQSQRADFVRLANTTIGYAERVAGGFARPSIPMITRMVRASKGKTSQRAILATYEKRHGPIV